MDSQNRAAALPQLDVLEPRILLDALGLSVSGCTSSTVSLAWSPATANQIRVYVSPEPNADKLKLLATLPGSATSFKATQLAADSNMFFTLQVDPTSGGTLSQMAGVQTSGGPSVPLINLDNALREVHMYGPNVIQVVLTDHDVSRNNGANNDGPAYESGTWRVTRLNGQPIGVVSVYRNSIAIDTPSERIGYAEWYDDDIVDADHNIYLKLSEPVGNEEVLTIAGPKGVSFLMPFSDKYTETPVLQVNQVGYNPLATERWAYVSGWMGDGGALSLSNMPATANVLKESADPLQARATAVSSIPVTVRSSYDSDAGTAVNQIDLSYVPPAEGVKYRVQLPGVGVSYVTAVSEEAVYKAYYVTMRGLFMNRWGQALTSQYTDWTRPADHTTFYIPPAGSQYTRTNPYADDGPNTGSHTDHFFDTATPTTTPVSSSGGYHDAGDWDQRPMHAVVPTDLLEAYDANPSNFTDGQLTIPNTVSGVALPDELDEALWGVNGWVTLQDASGGVRGGVESIRSPYGYYHADQDPNPWFAYEIDVNTTARAAALFAEASRLVAPYSSSKASDLSTRAANAYNYAKSHGASASFMIYAAGELFRLTGNTAYRTDFDGYWNTIGGLNGVAAGQLAMSDYASNYHSMAAYLTSYCRASGATQSIKDAITSGLMARADSLAATTENQHAFRNSRGVSSLSWGMSTGVSRDLEPIYAMMQVGGMTAAQKQAYINAMSLDSDFVLGANPLGQSFITGLGTRYVQDPLNLDAQTWMDPEYNSTPLPVQPGISVYGPVDGLQGDTSGLPTRNAMYPDVTSASYPAFRKYADTRSEVICNEYTIWEDMAPNAEMWSMQLKSGLTVPSSWLPGQPGQRSGVPGGMTAFNDAPAASAGTDQTIFLPTAYVRLQGRASDDGYAGSSLTSTWTKVSGPGNVIFGNVNTPATTAAFSMSGSYVLRLTSSDGTYSTSDDVNIVVIPTTSVLVNGGFETGDLTAWTGSGISVVSNNQGGSGNYILHATGGDWLYPAYKTTQNGSQQTNTNYMLSFKMKWATATNKLVLVGVRSGNGTITTMNVGYSADWQTYTLTFNSGSAAFWVDFTHEGGNGAARDYYLDDVVVGKIDVTPNQSPLTDAGPDQFVWDSDHNGTHNVTLDGRASTDVDGSISSYVWKEGSTQIATGANPTVSLATGTHTITLTATDNSSAYTTDTVVVVVSGNQNPIANAGPDQYVVDSDGNGSHIVTLNGSGSSDPDGSISSYVWKEGATQIATGATPTVTLSVGTHTITLNATDNGGAVSTDTAVIVVAYNQAPNVSAGLDMNVLMPNTAKLDGLVADENSSTTVTWSKTSGPGSITYGNINATDTTALFSTPGTYVLRLTANDGITTSYDEVTIWARPATAPFVNDGNTTALYHLDGSLSDSSGHGYTLTSHGNATFTSNNLGWMSQPSGQALYTGGRNDYLSVAIPDSNIMPGSSQTPLTVEAQIYIREYTGYNCANVNMVGLVQDWDSALCLWDGLYDASRVAQIRSAAGTAVSDSVIATQVPLNMWHTLKISMDSSGLVKGYIDGVVLGQATLPQNANYASNWNLQIGGFVGYVDEVRISNVARPDGGNQAPIVNAGQDATISQGTAANLDGTVSDDGLPSGTLNYTWSKTSGPGTVTFVNPSAVDTTATFSATGTYVLRLTSSDSALSAYDEVQIIVNSASNTAPSVNAGNDFTITLPSAATLNGSVTDDGLPSGTLTYTWSKTSGPGSVTFGNGSVASTTATFSTSGTYVLRLTSSDGALASYDEVQVTVNPASNQAPSVNAGNDISVTMPSAASLSGTVTDDGLPSGTLTYTWSKTSGPGTATFANGSAVSTTATFSTSGTYVLRLTASDGSLSNYDELVVTVNPSSGGTLYTTGFDTDVSADWTMNTASIVTGSGDNSYMVITSGWGYTGYGYLSGSKAINAANVTISGRFGVMSGNSAGYAEIAGRTSGTGTDGIRLQVTGSYDQASVYLYDGTTLLASQTNVSGLRSQYAPLAFSLVLNGTAVTATITQTTGSSGSESWTNKVVTLTGTATTNTAGNVRFKGCSYIDQPRLYDITVTGAANQLPTANAGVDQNVTDADGDGYANVTLNGSASSDPDGSIVSYVWTEGANQIATGATPVVNFAAGTHTVTLTVTDNGGGVGTDTAVITVTTNQAPVVNAGTDQSVTLPSGVTVSGTVTDDGLPAPASLTYTWSKFSGPGTVTFGSGNARTSTATFSTSGTYILRLTASDGGRSSYDDVAITVNESGTLYSTGFDTDVSADWAMNTASIVTGTGDTSCMIITSGWGYTGYGYLTGSKTINALNVTITGRFGVMSGNSAGYAEIAGRTSGTGTDGIRLQVTGSFDQGSVYLYDGTTLLASSLNVAGLYSQFAPLAFSLALNGTAVTATITQSSGSGGGQTWSDKVVTLTGTALTNTAGNVRFKGCSYMDQPRLFDINIANPPNQAPVANNDSFSVNENTTLTGGVLTNDTDADNNTLTAVGVTNPSHGTLTLNSNGSFTYVPSTNWYGTDSFTYKAYDGTVYSNAATVTLTVNHVNQAPVAVSDSYSTNENTQLVVSAPGVLANDTDVDGDTLTASKVTDPSHGTVTFNSNGSFTYAPATNWYGTDSFTYKVYDGQVYSGSATVTLTVNHVNQAPVATADSYTMWGNQTLTVSNPGVLTNDTDVDGDTLTAIKVANPSHGTITLNSNGSFTYVPSTGWYGSDSFTYKAYDGALNSNTVTVSFTVNNPLLYSTGFDTTCTSDWTTSNVTQTTGSGLNSYFAINSGWGVTGYAYLTGSKTINTANVAVTGTFGVMAGNSAAYTEIACRTSGSGTNGIRLQVTGSYDQGSVYLYDGTTLLASQTNVSGLRTQFATLAFNLTVTGTSITATVTQTAGSGGGQTWGDKVVTLTGTALTTTAGNVRWTGCSYTDQPKLYDIAINQI